MLKSAVGTFIFFLFTAGTIWAGTLATYSECQHGCQTGNQACFGYCSSLFDPCFNHCVEQAREFIPNCIASDRKFSNDETRYTHCRNLMYSEDARCKNYCYTIKKEVDYPGWMPEQECPYDCQKWNPASRTCVGAPMNGCGGW